jgi:hypothetical protein
VATPDATLPEGHPVGLRDYIRQIAQELACIRRCQIEVNVRRLLRRRVALRIAVVLFAANGLLAQSPAETDGQLLVAPAPTQPPLPTITAPPRRLRPGQHWEMYGTHLGPEPVCGEPIPPNGPYPTEACGVRVTAAGVALGLIYVSPRQINIKVPESLPDGLAAVQVCVRSICGDPVLIQFSAHTAFLIADEPLYVQMPIWIEVELPYPYHLMYPCGADPWEFNGGRADPHSDPVQYKIEVLRNGALLAPVPQHRIVTAGWLESGICVPTHGNIGPFRLPLHLSYQLDSPGAYAVRLTGTVGSNVVVQSAWTDLEVKPRSSAAREAWLRSIAEKTRSAKGVWDIVPIVVASLMAYPDERALRILLPVYSAWLRRRRSPIFMDYFYTGFLRYSLAAFDEVLLRRVVPPSTLAELCPPEGRCKDLLKR